MKLIDLTGEQFGKLTVIARDLERKNKGTYWICKCECGNLISARKDQLTRSKNPKQSCGCDLKQRISQSHLKDEIGNQYGYLTVIERAEDSRPGEARWLCKCKCGNLHEVAGNHLRNGTVKSCGCYKYESKNGIDETGKRYGQLTVLYRSERTDGSHIFWTCRCDCGNLCDVNGTYLRNGTAINCGCTKSLGEQKIKKILEEHNINYKKEYTFPDLLGSGKGRLRFDFAVFDSNDQLQYLIEYDGIQHYEANCFGTEQKDFNQLQLHDQLKDEYCKTHNIPLIRIKYTKFNTLTIDDLIL